ncbi:Peroxin 12 [Carabus blaptoides fortunei]
MAERGAHLTATFHPKPSIFDVVAQDSLNSTIHPALQRIIQFLYEWNPDKYYLLLKCSDEIYLILNGFIQYHYIQKYGASFSEYFYGLKRVPVAANIAEMTDKQKNLSLIFLIYVPYLMIKLKKKLATYRLELADGVLANNWEKRMKKILCSLHGLCNVSWGFWTISHYLKCMQEKHDAQLPLLKLLQLKYTYGNMEEENTSFWVELFNGNLSFSKSGFSLIGQMLSHSLEIVAFTIHVLKSWNMQNYYYDVTALPKPDPPEYHSQCEIYRGICPICMQRWKIPTVVAVSGYVFCFRCIVRHLQESNTCPVTKFPTNMSGLVRLYEE